MKYYELSFNYESQTETEIINDILAAELGDIGFESFEQTDNGLLAYVAENKFNEAAVKQCLNDFPLPDINFNYSKKLIDDVDWNEEWEKNYFKPIRIGKECLIRASFHQAEAGYKYQIIIDPKMAFGTGNHSTTYLMINEILKSDLTGKKILDMGCGTAVLAILAAMKDADRVVGIDIDKWAYNNAIENCKLNGTEKIELALGGAEQIKHFGTFDIIFANINRNILLDDIRNYTPALNKGGLLYMSGFYKEDIPVIEEECCKNGLKLLSFEEQKNWVAVKTIKNS